MKLNHVALCSRSEANCDRFFVELLGLEKIRSKVVPADLSIKIFDRDDAFTIVEYGNQAIKFEIFLSPDEDPRPERLDHVCLEVEDRHGLLKKAEALGFQTRKIPKQGDFIFFIEDFDGNLFELKPKV